LVEAPTGTGKSPIALTASLASKRAYIATANKFLQDQYMRDFSKYMVDLKGRANYLCTQYQVADELKHKIGEFYNCSNSPCQSTEDGKATCAKDRKCEYHKQLDLASQASITSFNFASALAFLNYLPKNFGKRNLIVCDECHNIPNWITNFVSVEFNLKTLMELGLQKFIPDYAEIDDYAEYLFGIQQAVNRYLSPNNTLEAAIVEKLESLSRKFELFDKITDDKSDMDNFIVEKVYDLDDKSKIIRISFKPVVIHTIVKDYLFKHAKKALLLSATILDFPTFMELMGLPKNETAIIRVPSLFPIENRLIQTKYAVGYINQKNLDATLSNIVKVVDGILNTFPNVKGIIHGVTYKICNYIFENLESNRLLYPKTAGEQKNIFDEHVASNEPTILLSPSMTEGVDLVGDSSRLQIIVKMPYPYLGDLVLKRRMVIYPNYYHMLTALTLTQAYGRSIRSMDDYCFTFILDRCFLSFVQAHGRILQPSFIEAIR
jgi:Rad3-related DNA helicase